MNYLERNFPNFIERQENIAELIGFASQFKDLPEFLERVSLLQATDTLAEHEAQKEITSTQHPAPRATVSLMTIHLAKGLEFDRVFIVGTCEGLLPHGRAIESDRELEEERRLMYVAMTRARKSLAISWYDVPSRFISEIPAECAEYVTRSEDDARSYSEDSDEKYVTLD